MQKVCIIGCGMIANSAHIPAYKAKSDIFDIVAVCDFSKEAAQKTAREHGIAAFYTDAEEMLKNEKPDVVSVCVPNMLHKKYVLLALSNGANVLCEKPLAINYKDAKEMFSLAQKEGKLLMACQSIRYLPERLAAFELIKENKLGEVYYCSISRIRRRGIPTWGKFHLKDYSGGGAMIDIGVHAIDSAIWLMGNPKPLSVRAQMLKVHADEFGSTKSSGALKGNVDTSGFDPEEMDVESFVSGVVCFENGAALDFRVSWAANIKEENNIILSAQNCGVDLENHKVYSGTENVEDLAVIPNGFKDEPFYGHFCLVENLAQVLLGKAQPMVKPDETLNITAIIEAAYISANQGREVLLKEIIND